MNLPGVQVLEIGKHYMCENPDANDEVMKCELIALNPDMTHALVDFNYGSTAYNEGKPVIAAAHELKAIDGDQQS